MVKVTVEEYAKHRGIAERSVRRYLADKLIPASAQIRKGRLLFLDQAKADKAIEKHGTTRREILGEVSLPVKGKTPPVPVQQATTQQAGTAGLTFHEARTLKERYLAALRKIELDEKTGRLVEVEQVKLAAFNKARQARDTLLNIPDRIAPILAAERDQMKVAELLTRELRDALEGLSA